MTIFLKYFGWFLMKSQKLHFRTEVTYGSMKCLKLLLGLNLQWTWIHLPITSTFAWDIRIINSFIYIADCLHLDNCMKHIFFCHFRHPRSCWKRGDWWHWWNFQPIFLPWKSKQEYYFSQGTTNQYERFAKVELIYHVIFSESYQERKRSHQKDVAKCVCNCRSY